MVKTEQRNREIKNEIYRNVEKTKKMKESHQNMRKPESSHQASAI